MKNKTLNDYIYAFGFSPIGFWQVTFFWEYEYVQTVGDCKSETVVKSALCVKVEIFC